MKPKKYEEMTSSERITESDKVAILNIHNELTRDVEKVKKRASISDLSKILASTKILRWSHILKQIVLE